MQPLFKSEKGQKIFHVVNKNQLAVRLHKFLASSAKTVDCFSVTEHRNRVETTGSVNAATWRGANEGTTRNWFYVVHLATKDGKLTEFVFPKKVTSPAAVATVLSAWKAMATLAPDIATTAQQPTEK